MNYDELSKNFENYIKITKITNMRFPVLGLEIFTVNAKDQWEFSMKISKVYLSWLLRYRGLKNHNSCYKLYHNRKLFAVRHTQHKQFS